MHAETTRSAAINQHLCVCVCLQNPLILDPEVEEKQVKCLVGGLLARLNDLRDTAATYKGYQKNFKVKKRMTHLLMCVCCHGVRWVVLHVCAGGGDTI